VTDATADLVAAHRTTRAAFAAARVALYLPDPPSLTPISKARLPKLPHCAILAVARRPGGPILLVCPERALWEKG